MRHPVLLAADRLIHPSSYSQSQLIFDPASRFIPALGPALVSPFIVEQSHFGASHPLWLHFSLSRYVLIHAINSFVQTTHVVFRGTILPPLKRHQSQAADLFLIPSPFGKPGPTLATL